MDMALQANAATAGSLLWHNLSVEAGGNTLLPSSSGMARAGRLLGILAPSGAGKSTLLSAFAGVLPANACVRGIVVDAASGANIGVACGTAVLLEQDDSFFSELTVRETLVFAAELYGNTRAEAAAGADSALMRFGLVHLADRRIGERRLGAEGSSRGGLSGGERRRLAVACALAGERGPAEDVEHNASVKQRARTILADEPTTGLDAFQAARVVALLKELAVSRRCAVACSLHQPRASIWHMLDDIVMLTPGGHLIFCGPASTVQPYFEALGYHCPKGEGVAEFAIDLVSINTEYSECAASDRARISDLVAAFSRTSSSSADLLGGAMWRVPAAGCPDGCRPLSIPRTLYLLVQRSSRQMVRDRLTNALRCAAALGLSSVFVAQYGQLDGRGSPTARSVASRICIISFACLAMAMLAMARAVDRFARERAVVGRERAARRYGGCVYLAAKLITELPTDAAFAVLFSAIIHRQCCLKAELAKFVSVYALVAVASGALGLAIGAAAPRADQAMTMAAPVMAVHMLTGVIDPSGQAMRPGAAIVAIRSLSPMRHAIEAACTLELSGMPLARSMADAPRMGGLALVSSGDEVLRQLGVEVDFSMAMLHLAALFCLHVLLAAAALIATSPQFARASRAPSPIIPLGATP